jgi:hypothetical protein
MTPEEFATIRKMTVAYMATLDLATCKQEMIANGLLTQNAKLLKGENDNYGLELLPSVLSGRNLCAGAGKCKLTCLAFSGVGNLFKSKKMIAGEELSLPIMAKARRTFVFIADPDWFIGLLKAEIEYKAALSRFSGKKVFFRLNTTSDVDWRFLTDEMPHIAFYDYCKVWDRVSTLNYRITFSVSETTTDEMIRSKLENGETVAVVFHKVPKTFLGFPVVDGDLNDDRSADPMGVVVGLKYKVTVGGKDDTDFVR